MSDFGNLETLDDGEPPSLRSWNEKTCDQVDLEYEMLRQDYQKREINHLLSIGVERPGEWVREMNIPSAQRTSELVPVIKKRKLGKELMKMFFRVESL